MWMLRDGSPEGFRTGYGAASKVFLAAYLSRVCMGRIPRSPMRPRLGALKKEDQHVGIGTKYFSASALDRLSCIDTNDDCAFIPP